MWAASTFPASNQEKQVRNSGLCFLADAIRPRIIPRASQTEALVKMGALDRAKANRAKLAKLCPTGCAQLTTSDETIALAAATPANQARNN